MDEVAALPSPAVVLSAGSIGTTAASDAIPAGRPLPGSPPLIGRHAPVLSTVTGPGKASPVPAVTFRTFRAPYAEEFLAAALQDLHRFHGLHPEGRGSALPYPACAGTFTARQASRNATDRSVAPPEGLLTLGFDPARFQTEPPACYRAPWRLPGPDSHRLATTSFRSSQITSSSTSPLPLSGCTPVSVERAARAHAPPGGTSRGRAPRRTARRTGRRTRRS